MNKLTFLFLFILQPLWANAYDAIIDGIYYDFNSTNKTATVTYRYEPYDDYSNSSAYSGDVIIPETVLYNGQTYTVTSIGVRAFFGCTGLTSVTIPEGVMYIGDRAFRD